MVKVKKPTDPNCPKRPQSAFLAWRAQNYQRIVKTMPVGHSFGELAKKLSVEWKAVTPEEKKPFEETFEKKLVTYKKLMNAYKQTSSYKEFQQRKKNYKLETAKSAKFRKDENAPKKPLTGYFMFLDAKREPTKKSNPDLNHKQVVKKLGEMWSKMSDAEKKVYNDKSAAAKKKYQVELENYKKTANYKKYQEEKEKFNTLKSSKVSRARKRSNPDAEEYLPSKRAKVSKSPKAKAKSPRAKSPRNKTKKPKAPKKASKKASKKTGARKSSKKAGKKKSKRKSIK